MTPTATLTRIHLNLAERTVRRDLADRNQLHKTLMRLTPGTPSPHPRRDAGLLFRLDPDAHQPTLLIQSTQPPRLHRLPPRYGTADTRDLTAMFNALQPGLRLRYRITAAPVRCVPGPAYGQRPDGTLLRRRGTPTPLHGEEALAWWQRRATGAGLDLEDASLTPCTFECPPRSSHPDAPYHRLTQFDGHARITDPAALTAAICRGIGRAQSYGAGLLSIAPAQPNTAQHLTPCGNDRRA